MYRRSSQELVDMSYNNNNNIMEVGLQEGVALRKVGEDSLQAPNRICTMVDEAVEVVTAQGSTKEFPRFYPCMTPPFIENRKTFYVQEHCNWVQAFCK